ncbi:MAG: hypothetical protein NTW87_18110 [Planctomycetota bacterium]|nr:hypothetical protein [Planctomycetota bacterium]
MARIDLVTEVLTLFKDEDMLAFFQFQRKLESGKLVQGLCKVAKSKSDPAKMNYFSIDFIVDSPESAVRQGFDSVISRLENIGARRYMREAEAVTLYPGSTVGSGTYIRHADVIMAGRLGSSRLFVDASLRPALENACGLKCEEPVWWEDIKDIAPAGAQQPHKTSLIDRLRQSLKL